MDNVAIDLHFEMLDAVEADILHLTAQHKQRRKSWQFQDFIPWEQGRNFATGIERSRNIINTNEWHTAHGSHCIQSGQLVSRQRRGYNTPAGFELYPYKRTSPFYRSGYKCPSSS